jgi:hypothetical protein
MTDLSKLMFIIIIIESLTLIYSLKVLIDWTYFKRYRRENAAEKLMKMQHAGNEWIFRHMGCALLATIMIVTIIKEPTIQGIEPFTEIMTAYAIISLMFAFAESILTQRIAILARK